MLKEVHVKFFIKPALPLLDLRSTSRHSVQSLHVASLVIQIIDSPPWESWHPELGFVVGVLEPLANTCPSGLLDQGQVDHPQDVVLIVDGGLAVRCAKTSTALAEQSAADHVRRLAARTLQPTEESRTAGVVSAG